MIKQLMCIMILTTGVVEANKDNFYYIGVNVEKVRSAKDKLILDDGNSVKTLSSKDIDSISSSGIDMGIVVSLGNGFSESFDFYYNRVKIDNENMNQFGVDMLFQLEQILQRLILKPYLGLGFSLNNAKDISSDDNLGFRLRAGVFYDINDDIEFGAEYFYQSIEYNVKKKTNRELNYDGIRFILNYKFE